MHTLLVDILISHRLSTGNCEHIRDIGILAYGRCGLKWNYENNATTLYNIQSVTLYCHSVCTVRKFYKFICNRKKIKRKVGVWEKKLFFLVFCLRAH